MGLLQTEVCIAEKDPDVPLTNAILKRMGGLGALTPQSTNAVQISQASQRIACLPDSLPVLGPAMYTRPNVICSFGHGHQSLCMASATAAVLTDLVAHRTPRVSLKPYAANRKF